MDEQSERRLTENEVIFRQANKDMKDFLQDMGTVDHAMVSFFCECSDTNCRGRIDLSAQTYKDLHKAKQHFIVLPGHSIPELEKIIQHGKGYDVVEKLGEVPGDDDINQALRRLTY